MAIHINFGTLNVIQKVPPIVGVTVTNQLPSKIFKIVVIRIPHDLFNDFSLISNSVTCITQFSQKMKYALLLLK